MPSRRLMHRPSLVVVISLFFAAVSGSPDSSQASAEEQGDSAVTDAVAVEGTFTDDDLLGVDDEGRQLQFDPNEYITTLADMDLPDNHVLFMAEGSLQSWTCSSFCTAIEGAHAGANYSVLEIKIPGGGFQFSQMVHRDARLKVVDNTMSEPLARDAKCQAGEPLVAEGSEVENTWGESLGSSTSVLSADTLRADDYLVFKMGGNYRLCYSTNGTFGELQADITRQRIEVSGVFDRSPSCTTDDCLSHHRYECYLRREDFSTTDGKYGLQTSCIVDYSYPDSGFFGPVGKGTWTAEFTAEYDERTGQLLSLVEQPCTSEPADFICRNGGACQAGDPFIEPDASVNSNRINIPTTRNDLLGNEFESTTTYTAKSVAACYCPARDGCVDKNSFIQQIGILYFYASKVCHAGSANCDEDFNGVTGQYRFRIRVECPADACDFDDKNRIKLVGKTIENDLPSWDTGNGCRTAVHGMVQGLQVLPPTVYDPSMLDGSEPGIMNEANCNNGPLGCQLNGGTRQDYKSFGGRFGFRFIMGFTDHEAKAFHTSKDVDICYCNTNCEVASSWFKTGSLRLAPTRLVSSATWRSNLPAQWSLEFVNQPGIIGLYRPYADAGVLGLQENSLLKLVTDQEKQIDDVGCALSGYNSQFTSGLSDEVAASLNYLGKRQTQTPPDLQKIIYNSDSFVNTITVGTAGTLAICYCAVTVDNLCIDQANWKLVSHMTIKGPKLNQRWAFSTNVVFRFSYEGYGLTSGDTLRIIAADGKCTDDNFNPNTAAFAYTALKVKCPVPCTDVGLSNSAEPGDLTTKPLADDAYRCDIANDNCETNDITSVTVIDEDTTELVFQFNHGMLTGDEVTLGDNIHCAPGDPVCTPEMLSALKGVYLFADHDANSGTAPDSYMATHKLFETSNKKIARISIGWPSPAPKFTIIYAGAKPEIGYIGRGGRWTHHSRAQTREEVMATAERANLRVCWRFGGNGAKYVEEVGKMTIRDPAPMLGATLSMTSFSRKVRAPMILTFTTAAGVTGLRYEQAEDSLRLKVVFTHTDLVDILYTDSEASDIPYDVPKEDDVSEASQTICGKLFLELWSADMERGFPMPKGCYYKGFEGGFRREVFILFEGKSGLRKATTYQLVFNAIVKEDNFGSATIVDQVRPGAELMELFPMDDVSARPYEAIERGIVTMTTDPKYPTIDRADPQFPQGGFKIVGGYQDLLQIKSGDSLEAELMGHPTTGKILGSHIIRIFLTPLTQWQTTSSCTAECVKGGEVSFKCGRIDSCLGLAAVPGRSLNILKITLPPCETAELCEWDELYGNRKVRLRVGGITIPSGGFFAQRLAAQITDKGDSRPNYTMTSGNFIWKEPNVGITSARVISITGGANAKPFRGDKMNVLYARLTLSSTIKARDDSFNDASFTITLPQGFICKDVSHTADPPGANTWEAPADLPAFGWQVPQGRGTPSDGSATHGWRAEGNRCIFTPFHPDGVVYAGSSLVVKITVDNPSFALQRAHEDNVWTVHYNNIGVHVFDGMSIRQETTKYRFTSPPDLMYQTNNAIFGMITDTSCQPSVLSASTKKSVIQELNFFFRTEQEVGSGGLVRLNAPKGFSFGQPCNASDLPATYYATQANPADATLPLPGIVSCVSRGPEVRIAEIRLERILTAGRLFGFKIRVENPTGFDISQMDGWTLFTADSQDYVVDGTPETIPFTEADSDSWGIYTSSDLELGVKVSDLRPYLMSGKRAWVSVLISKQPPGDSGFIRFRAPEGYIWSFDDSEFIYQTIANAPEDHRQYVPAGITADFPSGIPLPRDGSNTLIFRPGIFRNNQIYGFTATLEVPDKTPTTSSNSFFFEMGFNSTSTRDRPGAAQVEAPKVRALKNADVIASTTILGKENLVQFRIETITDVPFGGGIEILVPEGFKIDVDCELLPVRDPDAPPPPDLSCEAFFDSSLGVDGRIILRLRTGEDGLPAGHHAFALLTENPKQTWLNYPMGGSGVLACGTLICWTFDTFQYIANITHPSSVKLDFSTSAQGFDITRKMLEARIPTLTEEQRLATGRDDRPDQQNSIIFAVKLSQDSIESGEMVVTGPYGFTFAEECLKYVEVSEAQTFGPSIRFPEVFTVWPVDVLIRDCRGDGRIARLQLEHLTGAVMLANELYIFRIGVLSNPKTTPAVNRWTVQFAGEASEPIEGMTLWAFTDTSVFPITTARDRTLAGQTRTQNPLKIRLRPFNTIEQNGEIRAVAPEGFQFVHLPSKVCTTELEELPYVSLGIFYPGFVWPEADLVCLVDPDDSTKVTVKYRNPRPISAGLQYMLVLSVYNPKEILSLAPTIWQVSSFSPEGLSLDQSEITGFRLNEVLNLWTYSNPDPNDRTQEVRNGGARLPEFSLKLRNPSELEYGDEIHIRSPQDFNLIDDLGNCRGFRWVDPNADIIVATFTPLPSSLVRCNASTITIFILEPAPVSKDFHIEFGLDLTNPLRTPVLTDNFWRCVVLSTALDQNGDKIIKASKAFQSWDIVPQLENLQVRLLGPNTAAESYSSISVEFTPVTSAEDIAIQFNSPERFDFTRAFTDDADNQEIFLRQNELVRVRLKIQQGVRETIILRDVLLGTGGGQTDISLTTWRGGLFQGGDWVPGIKQDERINYRGGFRLPGSVSVLYDKLENTYHQDPLTYPEQSLWGSQMGRPAYAEFHFHLSIGAQVGHFLKVAAFPYEPTRTEFSLVESPVGQGTSVSNAVVVKKAIQFEITTVFGGEIHARLLQPLIPYRRYELVVSVIAPTAEAAEAHGGPIKWFIETRDFGQLPTNTNDGVSREFPIVEEYGFVVQAPRSPPLAEIVVTLKITPALAQPTSLRVIAPLEFNFSSNCLDQPHALITDCQPGKITPSGRATASLSVRGAPAVGIEGEVTDVMIRVSTPSKTPVAKEWFVEGTDLLSDSQLGWGESEGIDVLSMKDTSATYPGFSGVRARMVWRFRTQQLVQAGGWLDISLPRGFQPDCGANSLEAIALPTSGGCAVPKETQVIVFLNTTIVPREYVFAFYVTPPTGVPLINEVSVVLKDRFGAVSDAAVGMPGARILEKLRIRESPLLWTSTKPLRESQITIGFEVLEKLPDLVVAPNQQIDEILITLPAGFTHLVEKLTDLQLMNEEMPLRDIDYLDYFQKDRLRISLELNRSSWTTLKSGTYGFRFNVMVPSPLPTFNVWHLSLCSPNYPNGCSRITDPAVMATFAMPGFTLGGPVNGLTLTDSANSPAVGALVALLLVTVWPSWQES
eukprot:TRINITY_DN28067_c0_g1_i1.p1 TRINITY_DN28067_c0_g1~~TRINITY_DN28067_c0_g1_i1.p1  ORF type:complete len:3244 (-),score=551.12 TRINITY_DN28067_c0_g1_i1:114-9845(-)